MSDRLPAGPPFDRPIFASAAATTRASAPSKMIQGAIRKATRSATHVVLRAIWGGMRKSTKVFHFAGLRRSGNHACINWLVNSIYGSSVEYRQLDHYLFREFPEGRVFLINSYAQEPALSVFRYVWKYRRKIARCEYLFLSLEDEPPSFTHFLRPKDNTPGVVNIHIDRTVFNLLSSRAKKIDVETGKPKTGIAGNFHMEEKLWEGFFQYRRAALLHWEYDQWLIDPEWRQAFLRSVGLLHDIMPGMSIEAGGSSFGDTSTEQMKDAGKARYKAQAVPAEWLDLIEQRFLNDLTLKEREQLTELRAAATQPG